MYLLRSLTVLVTLKLSIAQVLLDLQWSEDVSEYTVQVQVGTPGQNITMRIEFETFFTNYTLIPSTNSTSCANTTDVYGGCQFGSFNQNLSSTFDSYDAFGSDRDHSGGVIFIDTLGFNGEDGAIYIMHLSYDIASLPSNTPAADNIEPSLPFFYLLGDLYNTWDSLLDYLAFQDSIPASAFSLWLQDENSFTGGLLLGAIDTSRYEGELVSLDTYNRDSLEALPATSRRTFNGTSNEGPIMAIAMTSLSASSPTGTDEIWVQGPLFVRIKLGDDLWLSPYLAAQIRNITGAIIRYDETGTHEYTVIPCNMKNSEGYFTFGFGGPEAFKVNVTMASLVIPPSKQLRQLFNTFGEDMCRFGISEAKGYDVGFLSSHLLRSVYTVIDLTNQKVAMAPLKLDHRGNESNIVTFDGLSSPIPSATSASGQPTSISRIALSGPSPSLSYRAAKGFGITTAATTSLSVLKYSSSSGGNGLWVETYIVIISSIIAVFLMLLTSLVIWKRWKKRHTLATRLPFKEKPCCIQKDSLDGVQVQQVSEIDGNIRPAELSAVRELSELHGREICAELPGDHRFPERAKLKATTYHPKRYS
ncbi:acid protease [Annulohypoxylon maeteangense]|uniref:acid protease n=1 Tax=Annulohypoxylon maeteangense TaxID=1927788 RepID=UPI002007E5B2|nr:acid protease [Annulohypoxylon maeteangense]KAI0885443.1 acid protease [Annulohypoxylon maeteangense]